MMGKVWIHIILCFPFVKGENRELPTQIAHSVVKNIEPTSKIVEIVRVPIVRELHFIELVPVTGNQPLQKTVQSPVTTVPQPWFISNDFTPQYFTHVIPPVPPLHGLHGVNNYYSPPVPFPNPIITFQSTHGHLNKYQNYLGPSINIQEYLQKPKKGFSHNFHELSFNTNSHFGQNHLEPSYESSQTRYSEPSYFPPLALYYKQAGRFQRDNRNYSTQTNATNQFAKVIKVQKPSFGEDKPNVTLQSIKKFKPENFTRSTGKEYPRPFSLRKRNSAVHQYVVVKRTSN